MFYVHRSNTGIIAMIGFPTMHLNPTAVSLYGTCTPKVFNREELQYETYEMGVWDYWWGDASGEILEGEEILE